MPAEFPGLRQNNRKAWEVWVLPWTPGSKLTAPHLLPTSKKMPKPTFRVVWTEPSQTKKNHHCSEIQSTQIKPVRWQVAAQPRWAHCWTSQHGHSNSLNHSPREGKLLTLRKACPGGDLKSLENAPAWRTPVPKQWSLRPPNVPSLLTSSPKIGDTGCILSLHVLSFF